MQPLLLKPLLVIEKNREDGRLSSFFFWLAAYCSFVLDIDSYAFELTTNHLLNNQISSVQYLMTDWGVSLRLTLLWLFFGMTPKKKMKNNKSA